MIDSYGFGRIVVDGQTFSSDLIIFPDRIQSSWWRKNGHGLCPDDLKGVFDESPEVLIVGTGKFGLMKVPDETKRFVSSRGAELIIEKTSRATETFNKLSKTKRVVAALHLTC